MDYNCRLTRQSRAKCPGTSEVTELDMGLLHLEHWAIILGGQTIILVALVMLANHFLVSRTPPRWIYGLWLLVFV